MSRLPTNFLKPSLSAVPQPAAACVRHALVCQQGTHARDLAHTSGAYRGSHLGTLARSLQPKMRFPGQVVLQYLYQQHLQAALPRDQAMMQFRTPDQSRTPTQSPNLLQLHGQLNRTTPSHARSEDSLKLSSRCAYRVL